MPKSRPAQIHPVRAIRSSLTRCQEQTVRLQPIADIPAAWDVVAMTALTRVGALDIAEAIYERIGSYVDMNFMQFLAVEADRIHCWYMNSGGEGPSFHIELIRNDGSWAIDLTEHPPGTEQAIEVP